MSPSLARVLIVLAALLIAVATALGAVASHALTLDADAQHAFETAVGYQLVHSVGLLAIVVYAGRQASKLLAIAALAMLAGIVLFCGGVYASSLDGPRWIAGLAPAGGLSLIGAWLLVAVAALRR